MFAGSNNDLRSITERPACLGDNTITTTSNNNNSNNNKQQTSRLELYPASVIGFVNCIMPDFDL